MLPEPPIIASWVARCCLLLFAQPPALGKVSVTSAELGRRLGLASPPRWSKDIKKTPAKLSCELTSLQSGGEKFTLGLRSAFKGCWFGG